MLEYAINQGYSALDAQAWRDKLDGYAVVSGLNVTVDSGLTVSIASGTATVGETSGSVDTVSLGSSTTATLNSADATDPRKDTIYIDTTGTIQVETGAPEPADPSGNTRFNTFQPEPKLPSTDGTVLAEVWVGAGDTTLESDDIRDRRVPADLVGDRLSVQTATLRDQASIPSATTDGRVMYAKDSDGLIYQVNPGGDENPINEPAWVQDANSPFTASGSSSLGGTLASTYDEVMVRIGGVEGENATQQALNLQVNGVTSNYFYTSSDGTTTSGSSSIPVGREANVGVASVHGSLLIGGSTSGDIPVNSSLTGPDLHHALWGGLAAFATGPELDSFALFWDSDNISGTAEVYGRQIA